MQPLDLEASTPALLLAAMVNEVVCPRCHGKGFLRPNADGEAEDCPYCEGAMFVCEDPEAEWIADLRLIHGDG